MHDPAGVGLSQCIGHLRADAEHLLDPQWTSMEPLRERLARDELLRDVERRRAVRFLRAASPAS